ncbi:MAG: cyanophycinase [Chlorobi bacterium]|nr:cyanophycinase [Chlorobiota bacterium]
MAMQKSLIIGLTTLIISSCINSESKSDKNKIFTTGPEKGSLILVGGHLTSPEIYSEFMELAGGPDAPIVIVTTAAGDEYINDTSFINGTKRRFATRGFKNITLLHTRNRKIANSDSFTLPIKNAAGLWFTGGRQWRLVDAYANTKTYNEFTNLLKRGSVIGGSSAGATIQGSYLVRGDTKSNLIMMGDHEKGFGFIKNLAVDQHLLAMNRQYDIFEILNAKPELLGIGLDENTAIVVQGNQFKVIGEHYVAVYDGTFFMEIRDKEDWNKIRYEQQPLPKGSKKFYLLKKGQKYNMLERKVIPPLQP